MDTVQKIQIVFFFWPLLLLILGFFTGRLISKRHLARIERAEEDLSHIQLWTSETLPQALNLNAMGDNNLVDGNVTLSLDVFRQLLNAFSNIFGRNLKSAEELCERGRREAIIRMKRKAQDLGADQILHVRFSGYSVLGKSGRASGLEFLAYGTAVKTQNGGRYEPITV